MIKVAPFSAKDDAVTSSKIPPVLGNVSIRDQYLISLYKYLYLIKQPGVESKEFGFLKTNIQLKDVVIS